MTVYTKSNMLTRIAQIVTSGQPGAITGATLRQLLQDMTDSSLFSVTYATVADYLSGTGGKALSADTVLAAVDPVALTPGQAPDLNARERFTIAATASFTLPHPLNAKNGQQWAIRVTQDGTGNRIMSFPANTVYKFASTSIQALSTAPNAIDTLYFHKWDDTLIEVSMRSNIGGVAS
jgi:hypothetical protein